MLEKVSRQLWSLSFFWRLFFCATRRIKTCFLRPRQTREKKLRTSLGTPSCAWDTHGAQIIGRMYTGNTVRTTLCGANFKNRGYTDDTLKAWDELARAYRKNNVYLGECARILMQNTNYEMYDYYKWHHSTRHAILGLLLPSILDLCALGFTSALGVGPYTTSIQILVLLWENLWSPLTSRSTIMLGLCVRQENFVFPVISVCATLCVSSVNECFTNILTDQRSSEKGTAQHNSKQFDHTSSRLT